MSVTKKADPVLAARSEMGNATRAGDQARLIAARRDLYAAHVERAILAAVEAETPITEEQRERLAALLIGGAK